MRERERERGREGELGVASTGNSCMATIGEHGLRPRFPEHTNAPLVDGGFVQWRELVNKEGFRASLCSDTRYLNPLPGWWIRAKAGPMTIDFAVAFLCRAVDHGPCTKMPN